MLMPPHAQIEWQATLRIFCGSLTLNVLCRHRQDIGKASDGDYVHRGRILGK